MRVLIIIVLVLMVIRAIISLAMGEFRWYHVLYIPLLISVFMSYSKPDDKKNERDDALSKEKDQS